MPGWELIDEKENKAVNSLFDKLKSGINEDCILILILKIQIHNGSGRIIQRPLPPIQERGQEQSRGEALRGTHPSECEGHNLWF